MNILDVGCGNAKISGAIGIDFNPLTAADIVHDLNVYPWPLADSTFDRIVCSHIVEHVADLIRFMEEIHRIGQPGARVEIVTPHFSNRFSYTDPTHVRHLSLFSFDYFVQPAVFRPALISRALETHSPLAEFYSQARFNKVRAHLRFARPFRLTGIQRLANRFPAFYEAYWAFIFPARDLYFTLRIVK
ncbi:MAG TPA: methyltransferase domain-containing protein [Anaerolineae bacterium]|nr:methyltransferase domain-containing protein [Anaerolineae bacterium]